MKPLWLICAVLLTACGCAKKKIEVQSDGCYHGSVGGDPIDACGNKTYTLDGDPKCGIFVMKDDGTYLRARIKGKGPWQETTTHFDSVTVCD